jgi:L-amino acid N-acyltransferase
MDANGERKEKKCEIGGMRERGGTAKVREGVGPPVYPLELARDFCFRRLLDSVRGLTKLRPHLDMNLIRCDASFSDQILAIFNEAILNSTALYDYKPRTMESMLTWFENKRKGNFPVIGAVDELGELLGFASYGTFRAWPAYKYSIEHSIYVAAKQRGKGLGKLLLQEIIRNAREQNYHALIGGIDSQNIVSIHLHKHFGFQHAGTIRQVGFKFGRWLDLDFYQLILDTPARPVDG